MRTLGVNALDKLAGALAVQNVPGGTGAIILTSRVSIEMVQKTVQKTAVIGSSILVAISAPTALAVRTAEACGITLVGIVRGPAFEIFTYLMAFATKMTNAWGNGSNRSVVSGPPVNLWRLLAMNRKPRELRYQWCILINAIAPALGRIVAAIIIAGSLAILFR